MRKNDLIRVRHMLDAACEAMSFARDKTRADLDENRRKFNKGNISCGDR